MCNYSNICLTDVGLHCCAMHLITLYCKLFVFNEGICLSESFLFSLPRSTKQPPFFLHVWSYLPSAPFQLKIFPFHMEGLITFFFLTFTIFQHFSISHLLPHCCASSSFLPCTLLCAAPVIIFFNDPVSGGVRTSQVLLQTESICARWIH